jgi:DNA-binding transcriptional LysR family regulator
VPRVERTCVPLTAVVVVVDGIGHRLRPVEDWPPVPRAVCGQWHGETPDLRPYVRCLLDEVALCPRCWPGVTAPP